MALVILIIALVAIFIVKAISIAKAYEDLAESCTSFCWASSRPEDQETAASWTVEEPVKQKTPSSFGAIHRAKRASA